MSVTQEQVRRIEFLSKIRVPDSKIEQTKEQLSKVFSWIDKLKTLDVSHVTPLPNPIIEIIEQTPEREDIPHLDHSRDDLLNDAPEQSYGFFLVSKVVE